MSEANEMLTSSSFYLQPLGYFPHFFSEDERQALSTWGPHAAGLTDGSIQPVSEKESQFVEVAQGRLVPATRFQRIWLRYLQAVDIQTQWRQCARDLVVCINALDAANLQIEHLKYEVNRLKIWGEEGGGAQRESEIEAPKAAANAPVITTQSKDSVMVDAEAKSELFASDVTNRDQYLRLTEKGLDQLSDNQVFMLYNIVDGLGLTAAEQKVFADQHVRRKLRYSSEWSRYDGLVVHASTTGQ